MHSLKVILYWLVTNSGGHFKLRSGWYRPLWAHATLSMYRVYENPQNIVTIFAL